MLHYFLFCNILSLTALNEVSAYFIDGRSLRIKRTVSISTVRLLRLVCKFKQRTNLPYPYHYKKRLPHQLTVLISKNCGVPYRTYVPHCHPRV